MAQQTRRAPGRPKKTQETTVVEQPVTKVVSKKPPIRQKTEEVTHRIYEISRGGGVVTILRQKVPHLVQGLFVLEPALLLLSFSFF